MQSQIEVDKEDLYKKINCKGKKMVGKANNWINGEKIIVGINNSKLKLKKVKKKEKKANSTDQQKPNTEAEVYNSNKKCDWGKKKLKSLIRFHSAHKINNYNRGGKKEKWKNPKESTEQVKT